VPRTAGGGRYRLAPSLDRLFTEVDQAWPKRDRATDGWLGDTSHQRRQSEHNPDGRGVVHAVDIDTDGINVPRLLKAVIGHPAVWYVIHNGKIWSRTYGWRPRRYTGSNPHTGHVHISIRTDRDAEAWVGRWLAEAHRPAKRWREGDRGDALKRWQRLLGVEPDGVYGPKTAAAVNRVKRERGWRPDGVLGPGVRRVLRERS
jgi:peptidoglycan hydrolase-like protein with peptidoglycan-binding domain